MSSSRFLRSFLGPELFWSVVCVLVHALAVRNLPPTEAGSRFLEQFWYWLPLMVVPLTFVCFALPGAGRWWLLLRIDLAAMIGLFVAVLRLSSAIDYQDSRNSGVGAGLIVSLSLGYFILAVATVVTALVLWWRSRGRT